jgi:cell division protein FtsB
MSEKKSEQSRIEAQGELAISGEQIRDRKAALCDVIVQMELLQAQFKRLAEVRAKLTREIKDLHDAAVEGSES